MAVKAVTVLVRLFYSLCLSVLVDSSPVDTDEVRTEGSTTIALLLLVPSTSGLRDLSVAFDHHSELKNDD